MTDVIASVSRRHWPATAIECGRGDRAAGSVDANLRFRGTFVVRLPIFSGLLVMRSEIHEDRFVHVWFGLF